MVQSCASAASRTSLEQRTSVPSAPVECNQVSHRALSLGGRCWAASCSSWRKCRRSTHDVLRSPVSLRRRGTVRGGRSCRMVCVFFFPAHSLRSTGMLPSLARGARWLVADAVGSLAWMRARVSAVPRGVCSRCVDRWSCCALCITSPNDHIVGARNSRLPSLPANLSWEWLGVCCVGRCPWMPRSPPYATACRCGGRWHR